MSFDVHLLAITDGVAAVRDATGLRALLREHAVEASDDLGWIRTTDGETEVYGVPGDGETTFNGLMFTHASGTAAWELMVRVASLADLMILPVGCRLCLVDPRQHDHVPADLLDPPPAVVRTGRELLAATARAR